MSTMKKSIAVKIMAVTMALFLTGILGACSPAKEAPAPSKEAQENKSEPEPADVAVDQAETLTDTKDATAEGSDDVEEAASYELQLRPYEGSPYAQAIDAGLIYVAENLDNKDIINWMDYFFLDYIQRKFALDEVFAAENAFKVENVFEGDLVAYKLFSRLVEPGFSIAEANIPIKDATLLGDYEPAEGEELLTPASLKHVEVNLIRIVLQAMYCDVEPVDAAFAQEMLEMIQAVNYEGIPNDMRNYSVVYVALAQQWLQERGCGEAIAELQSVRESVADALVKTVEDQKAATDLAFEAMALLAYIGHADRINEQWLEKIIETQLPEGAWARTADGRAECRPAIFALWVLLEKALPEVTDIPWLR